MTVYNVKSHSKAKGSGKISIHQATFELKQRILLALNRIADKDTYQIGTDDLEKIAESLTLDGIGPFITIITDTGIDQKSAVRKECIRIMSTLARIHGELLGPYLGKMVGSIVKRLRDPDSIVRDACVETSGVLASLVAHSESIINSTKKDGGVFIVFARPLFEALGEQNKQVQSGSALCLSAVIKNYREPPGDILQRMLARVVKLLKNQHALAKPALLELSASLIQAGGASTANLLSAGLASIREALKSGEWATRKAASTALADIAMNCGPSLTSFKASCITSLESCQFDKVKPVRDTVRLALQHWRRIPVSGSPLDSAGGSFAKENHCREDNMDSKCIGDSGWKDIPLTCGSAFKGKNYMGLTNQRTPLSDKRTCSNTIAKQDPYKEQDWYVEIAVPKPHPALTDKSNDGSHVSYATKSSTKTLEVNRKPHPFCDSQCVDNSESLSVSDAIADDMESNRINHDTFQYKEVPNKIMGEWPTDESSSPEDHTVMEQTNLRNSPDSIVTECYSRSPETCYSDSSSELALIRKHLSEIEKKQWDLLNLFQMFMGNSEESLSVLHSKVLRLEKKVETVAANLPHVGHSFNSVGSDNWINTTSNSSSPRVSVHSSGTPVDKKFVHRPAQGCRQQVELKSKSRFTVKQVGEGDPFQNSPQVIRNPIETPTKERLASGLRRKIACQPRNIPGCNPSDSPKLQRSKATSESYKAVNLANEHGHNVWKRINEFLSVNDFESAFMEALCSGDQHIIIELMRIIGPVFDNLSPEITSELLTLTSTLLQNRMFLGILVPWLRQVVEVSISGNLNHSEIPGKAKRELLSAMQRVASSIFTKQEERRCIAKLALKLGQIWEKLTEVISNGMQPSQRSGRFAGSPPTDGGMFES